MLNSILASPWTPNIILFAHEILLLVFEIFVDHVVGMMDRFVCRKRVVFQWIIIRLHLWQGWRWRRRRNVMCWRRCFNGHCQWTLEWVFAYDFITTISKVAFDCKIGWSVFVVVNIGVESLSCVRWLLLLLMMMNAAGWRHGWGDFQILQSHCAGGIFRLI